MNLHTSIPSHVPIIVDRKHGCCRVSMCPRFPLFFWQTVRDISDDLFDITALQSKIFATAEYVPRDVKFGKPGVNLVKPRLKYRRHEVASPCFPVYCKNGSLTIPSWTLNDTFREIILGAEYRRELAVATSIY